MVTIGEQLQLSRRLAQALGAHRATILNGWLGALRDIPRDLNGRTPEVHLEAFAPPTLDALIAYLARGDRKMLRRVAVSWARRQDGMGVGLGESIRAALALGPALAPTLRRLGLQGGQPQVEAFLALLAEELGRSYTAALELGVAERARAMQAAEERLLSVQTVAGAVAQARDRERTLELIAREVLKLTGAEEAAVYLPADGQDDDTVLRPVIRVGPAGLSREGAPHPVEGTPLGHVYRSGHLLLASDAGEEHEHAAGANESARSSVVAPLRTRQGVIGVLGVKKPAGESFTRADVEVLGLFADQAAIALENARLLRETARRADELGMLYRIGAVVNRTLELDRILNDVLDYILDARGLGAGSIYLLDKDCARLELRARRGYPADAPEPTTIAVGEGPIGRVAASGELLLLDDARAVRGLLPAAAAGPWHYYGIPLRVKGRVLGVLEVFSPREFRPESVADELALMTSIGDQIGVAIDNANLLVGREEQLTQLATLNDILRAISATLDLDSLYDAIYAGCSRLFDTTNFWIALCQPVTGELLPQRWYERGARVPEEEVGALTRGLSPLVVRERRPLRTDDYWAECRRRGLRGSTRLADEDAAPLAWLGVPMLVGERVVGAIAVVSARQCYTDEDVNLLSAIASGCAVAIENARAYASEQRRADQLRALNEMSRSIVSIRAVDRLLPRITGAIRDIFDYSHAGILLYQPESDDLVLRAQANRGDGPTDLGLCVAVGQHIVGAAAAARAPLLVNDVAREPRFLRTPVLSDVRAELAVPIVLGDRLLGVLDVQSGQANAFDAEDVATLQTVADGVAVAIENAQLFAQSRDLATAEERNRLAREIHDTLAQGLTAVTLHLEVADATLDDPLTVPGAREKVRTALALTRANLEEARRSVMDLRAAPLQDLSLPRALEQLVERAAREGGFEGSYRNRGLDPDGAVVGGRLPTRFEAGFYRIAQELLSNIAKHADATQVDVTLERCNGSLVLAVADDGVGFDPAASRAPGLGGGFGLTGLRERVALLGGTLHLDSAPDEGTRVCVSVPLPK